MNLSDSSSSSPSMPLKRRSTRRLLVDPKRLKETRSPGGAPESPESEDLGGLPCSLPPSEVGLVPQPQEDEEDRVLLKSEEAVVSLEEVPCLSDDESDSDVSSSGSLSEDPVSARLSLRAAVQELLSSRVSGESFLQDGPCFQSAPEIPFCHMCKAIPIPQRKHHLLKGRFAEEETKDINCCFYAFRKLRVPRASSIAVNGFLDPVKDPKPQDLTLWTPQPPKSTAFSEESVSKAAFILSYIGDQFCELVHKERKCLSSLKQTENSKEEDPIVWKPAVKGVREMCDVCQTTIFNYHWICGKCGIFVCPDCYQFRKEGLVSERVVSQPSNDEYDWPLCGRGEYHRIERLMLAQIIPRDELVSLADKVHALRHRLGLRQTCHLPKEFEEAFKLLENRDSRALTSSKMSKSVVTSNRSTYNCRLCPDGSFKWPSILYKHCVFKHFHSDIWKDLPEGSPYVCPQCSYCGRNKTMLALHYGITHKVVVRLYQEALKSASGRSLKSSSDTPKLEQQQPMSEIPPEQRVPPPCPLCALKVSPAFLESHLTVHLREELLRETPVSKPWKCHKCHHIALSREALLRHLGITHRRTQEILEYRGYKTSLALPSSNEGKSPEDCAGTFICPFCESPRGFVSNTDYLRHLSEVHFKSELLDMAIKEKDVLATKPFRCRLEGCDYASHMKNLIIHLGVTHRFAVKLYYAALGEEEANWESGKDLVPPPVPKASSSGGKKACPFCSEKMASAILGTHVARSHFQGRLGHLLTMNHPFKCPLCPHISESSGNLLNHYGFYHKAFEKMTAVEGSSEEEGLLLSAAAAVAPLPDYSCVLCDEVPLLGTSAVDLAKHLVETHFKERLSKSLVLLSKGPPKVYKCPDCDFSSQSQATAYSHLGLEHGIVQSLYNEVRGKQEPKKEDPSPKKEEPLKTEENNFAIEETPFQQQQQQQEPSSTNLLNHHHLPPQHHHPPPQEVPQQQTVQPQDYSHGGAYQQHPHLPGNNIHQHSSLYPKHHHQHPQAAASSVYHPSSSSSSYPRGGGGGGNPYYPNYHPQQPPPPSHSSSIHHPVVAGAAAAAAGVAEPYAAMDHFSQQHPQQEYLHHTTPAHHPNNYTHDAAASNNYSSSVPPGYAYETLQPSSSSSNNGGGGGYPRGEADNNTSSSRDSPSPPPPSANEKNLMDCNLCTYKCKTMGDFMKHLVKVHFKQKLLDFMPKQKPFVCPWPNCRNEKRDRFNLAVHYGMTHKVVLQMLENMTNESTPTEEYQRAQCKLCHQCFTSQRYMLTHLSVDHFQDRLDEELPKASPWKCPKCFYNGSDIRALRIHFGTRHKVVVTYYAQSLGTSIHQLEKELRDARKAQLRPVKKEGDISCNFCPRTFAQNEKEYLKHTILHLRRMLYRALPENAPYTCPKCAYTEAGRTELLFHYGMVHTEVVTAYLNQHPSQLDIEMNLLDNNNSGSGTGSGSSVSGKGSSSEKEKPSKKKAKASSSSSLPPTPTPPPPPPPPQLPSHPQQHPNHHHQHHPQQQSPLPHPLTHQSHPHQNYYTYHHHQQQQQPHPPQTDPSSLPYPSIGGYPSSSSFQEQQHPPHSSSYQSAPQDLSSSVKHNSEKHLVPKLERPANASEDKKFPKCRICNYRYFNRLDLCRHFVDLHLREKLASLLPEDGSTRCPRCPLEYKDAQSRLRHLIWSHEDLESLVLREVGVKLSEFPSTARDLEISSSRDRRTGGKELTDLAGLPVNADIDVRCSLPKCELCGEEFTASSNKVRDKGTHLMSHFKDNISALLPPAKPYRCPKCTYEAKDLFNLSRHLGLSHKIVFSLMQEELGPSWQLDSDDSCCTCLICSQTFLNARTLNDHYCTSHYSERLGAGLPEVEPFDCPKCKFSSKNYLTLVRHLGSKHDMVKLFLQEDGYLDKDFAPKIGGGGGGGEQHLLFCPMCRGSFQESNAFLRHAAEAHFSETLLDNLPREPPFSCPYCPFSSGGDLKPLLEHYALGHKVVLRLLNDKFGVPHSADEAVLSRLSSRENGGGSNNSSGGSEECPLCHNSFGGRYILLRHLAECHFRERLLNGVENKGVYTCPSCEYVSKDRQAFVRHYGLVHKMVQHFLREMGIKVLEEESNINSSNSTNSSQGNNGRGRVSQPKYLELRDPYGHGMRSNNGHYSGAPTPQYYRYDQQQHPYAASSSSTSSTTAEYLPPPPPPPPPPASAPVPSPSHQPSQSPYYDPYFASQNESPEFYGFNSSSSPVRPSSNSNNSSMLQQPTTPGGSSQGNPHTPQPHDSGPPTPAPPNELLSSPAYNNTQQQQHFEQQFSSPRDNNVTTAASPVGNGGPYYQPQQQPQQQQHYNNNFAQNYPPPLSSYESDHKDEILKGPEVGTSGPYAIRCHYCSSFSKNRPDFLWHLSEDHFKNELLREAPSNPPYVCSLCNTEPKERTLDALLKHLGVSHSLVHKYIPQGTFAGSYVSEKESNKCPFCELVFPSQHLFHTHLCDTHFKDQLAAHLLASPGPTTKCPLHPCLFEAKDSQATLLRHLGMDHRFLGDMLKRALDNNYGSSPPANDNMPTDYSTCRSSYHVQQQQRQVELQPRQMGLPSPHKLHTLCTGTPPSNQQVLIQPEAHNNGPQLPSISEFFHQQQQPGSESFHPPPAQQQQTIQSSSMQPQIDGTFDHIASDPHHRIVPPPIEDNISSKPSSPAKTCELCFKTFEGKNKSMLKIQHLVFHFKDRLYANLKETSPPFACPEEGCSYTSKHKPDWARHYGSVHKYIEKYLKERLEEGGNVSEEQRPAKAHRGEDGLVQCFLCEDAPWFHNEDLLEKHFRANHGEFMREFNSPEALNPMGDEETPHLQTPPQQPSSKVSTSPKNCGRPCEICGYEPKTKNKSRERQDHLAMKHYKDRISADLSKIKQFHCPLCDYVGRDKQTIHRHYTGKHKVVEKYLAEDLASRKVLLFQGTFSQVDGAADIIPQFDGAEDVPMLAVKDEIEDEEEEEDLVVEEEEEDILGEEEVEEEAPGSSSGGKPGNTEKTCLLCAEPLKISRQYHYAYKHFRNRLAQTLPFSPPFTCPLCDYAAKYRFNLWMHYLSKHNFGDAWMEKTLSGEMEREPPVETKRVSRTSNGGNTTSNNNVSRGSNKLSNFWCDLCQLEIKATNESFHYASLHFQDKLQRLLREEVPHNCPFCHYEAKSYNNLCGHFLSKHGFLQPWIRDALEDMTEKMKESPLLPPPSEPNIKVEEDDFYQLYDGLSDEEGLPKEDEEEDVKICSLSGLGQGLRMALEQVQLGRKRKRASKRRRFMSKLFTEETPTHLLSEPLGKETLPPRNMTSVLSKLRHPTVDHYWICNGSLLVLNDSKNPDNIKLFQEQWVRGQPVIVANVDDHLDKDLWVPMAFKRDFGNDSHDIVNTRSGKIIPNYSLGDFWDGFEHLSKRQVDESGKPMLLKLKDWPTDRDICTSLPRRFADLMNHIPLPDYTLRSGRFNLAASMPEFFVRPDLGPKMYIAYGNALYEGTGTTNLHIDMSDACNVLVYVGLPKDGNEEEHYKMGLKQVDASGCDLLTRNRVRNNPKPIGAIWHIYDPRDADKIRSMLNNVKLEKGLRLTHNSDPIHDQSMYLDQELRERLYREYGVVGYAFPQCAGDTVFIPAGAPHQVRNIHNCIKIAEDFVTPENLNWCFYITEEFRHLSDTHTNHEDKLQIKNMLYHSIKDCVSVLEDWEKRKQPKEDTNDLTKSEIKIEQEESPPPPPS